MVSNQIRPPGFPPIQNNQNRFNPNQGNNFNQNRGTNFNQNRGSNFNQGQVYQPPTIQPPVYQAPPQQMQGVSKTDFENYVKANDAVLRNMQNQGQGLQNQMTNLTKMLSKFITSNTVSSSNSGTLPSQTVTNPHEHVNAITTRSGKTCEGSSTPLVPTPVVSTPLKEPEQNPKTSMDKVQKPSLENEPFSGSTTNHSDALPPSSSPVKTSEILEEFADELTLLKKDVHVENFQVYSNPLFEFDDNFTSSNENPLFNEMDEDVVNKNSNVSDEPVLLNTPLTDKVECSNPEDDIDEINAFLAMEVSSNFEEGYFDSEGDVTFLENLLSDDTTHNLAPEVISDHEPKQDESIHNTSITFSPRSDPLHHEFAGELLTLPSRTVREHEDYLNRMTLLCEISISRSQENVHANLISIIESLPISPILVEDSDPVQEEIDIFLVPDDLIPPRVENDDSKNEDNYGYIKNHKKTIKNGQARTRERKSAQNPEAKPKKSLPLVKQSKERSGLDWLFDIDLLTNSMNYEPVIAGNQTNRNAGIKDNVDAVPTQQYILLPLLYDYPHSSKDAVADDAGKKTTKKPANKGERNGQEKEGGASNKEGDQNVQDFKAKLENFLVQQKEGYATSTNIVSTISPSVSAARQSFDNADDLPTDPLIPDLEDTVDLLNTGIFSGAYDDEDEGA
ncbi:hypothetical protein Tco_0953446 [Tanacetum coccineum]|uniref:Uncharacterized protein n=1 Tax=Tanacetum coccineum TaxID=301880 RepID=A0ABQ5E2S5_9ASTR